MKNTQTNPRQLNPASPNPSRKRIPFQPEPTDSDVEEDADGERHFTTNWWNGDIPVAEGVVAKRFTRDGVDAQFRKAEELIHTSEDGKASIKLDSNNWTPFLVAVPDSFRQVRIVYAVSSIQTEPGAETKIFALHGEYIPGVAFPNVMVLPTKALAAAEVKVLVGKIFSDKRKDKGAARATWFTTKHTTETVSLPFLIPVPPVLIYNGFNKDIDAIAVYERWMFMREDVQEQYNTLDKVLRDS